MKVESYVEAVLSRLKSVTPSRDGWVARCSCPTHSGGSGDLTPSLRVTVGEGGKVLLHCRGGCSTDDILTGAGLTWVKLFCPRGRTPQEPLCLEPEEPSHKALALRGEVYEKLLAALAPLTKEHAAHLKARGLKRHDLVYPGYASFCGNARYNAWNTLYHEYGDALYSVPGFVPDQCYAVRFEGLLIPIRSYMGNVEALKLRTLGPLTDSGEVPRYVSFSGGGGQSCGARVHFPQSRVYEECNYTIITEGELKADVATALFGMGSESCVISIPGVANYAKAIGALSYIGGSSEGGLVRVDVAFDWPDVRSKANVRRCLLVLLRDLRSSGYSPGVLTWNGDHKGYDDALHAGVAIQAHRGADLDALEAELRKGVQTHAPSAKWPLNIAQWVPPKFPTASLPKDAADVVRAVAVSKQCPEDFPGVAVLTAAASAIGATRALEVKPGWKELPCLYSAIVAPPSSKKSPALLSVLAPVYERQRDATKAFETGAVPALSHTWIQDATTEAVGGILKDQPRGVFLIQDELVSWVLGNDQYRGGKGSDRQKWLSMWSSMPTKIDRVGGGSKPIDRPFLCALGGVQPDKLSAFVDAKGAQDGFVDRILFAWPELSHPAKWDDEAAAPKVNADRWFDIMDGLYGLEFDVGGPLPEPRVLSFSPSGRKRWASFYDAHIAEQQASGFPSRMFGPWGKFLAYCARFALVLCMLRSQSPSHEYEVEEEDVEGAAALVDYFTQHAHGVALGMVRGDLDYLLPRLTSMASEGPVGHRRAMREGGLLKSQALSLFKRAEDLGLGEVRKERSAEGRVREVFDLVTDED